MTLQRQSAPASEPLTAAETKSYLRVTDTDDDALIEGLIAAVRQQAEAFTGRALITQTWTLWLDRVPRRKRSAGNAGIFQLPVDFFDGAARTIEIPRPPLQSVSFVNTYDTANNASTFDASRYWVDTASQPGRLALNEGASWPGNLRSVNAVEIQFVAGYGDASSVPDALKQGMLLWIKLLFADKGKLFESDESTAGLVELNREPLPPQVQSLWRPFRLSRL